MINVSPGVQREQMLSEQLVTSALKLPKEKENAEPLKHLQAPLSFSHCMHSTIQLPPKVTPALLSSLCIITKNHLI